ncbi:Methyltransferase-like 26 [Planktothrix tepida]|uniref:SAM-dependent methyltransferase n=1 Tax=Planktothrix tepida PCC 9214 TaxID=671072 RepID=A0A1J1LTT4_9CYAN|nr:DUF938 domain-containing protein [Planktothrix tepida]CAD5977675.1 Methyltransferase-like 26 [Planktothrix tepida]CUR36008.1 conserved hypothetical protein [Planktothrix tepida PCC 9214]
MNISNNSRQYAPATERNQQPILEVLKQVLPPTGTILEIASGTGQHAVFFAPQLQPRKWLPSEVNPILRESILAWQTDCPSDNLFPPLELDVQKSTWLVEDPDLKCLAEFPITAIVNINMIHISPWSACLGLMAGANRILPSGGILYLYGAYKQQGKHTAPSNEVFDTSLRLSNPEWGVRDLEAVIEIATLENLRLVGIISMPANNLSVIFEKI